MKHSNQIREYLLTDTGVQFWTSISGRSRTLDGLGSRRTGAREGEQMLASDLENQRKKRMLEERFAP